MNNVGLDKLFLSLAILSAGTLIGWLLTLKVGGSQAGDESLLICSGIAVITFILQLGIFSLIRGRPYLVMAFYSAFTLCLPWFMLSLLVPVFWLDSVSLLAKWFVAILAGLLCVANLFEGVRAFTINWEKLSDPLEMAKSNGKLRTLDWGKIQAALRYEARIYIPGVPSSAVSLISVVAIFSMLIGLNLRNAYPLVSVFAWGIPCALFSSFFFQMIGYGLAQARKIYTIQKEFDVVVVAHQ